MKIKATAFRQNLYRYLDYVLDKGETIEIERRNETIVIMKKQKKDIYTIMDERNLKAEEPNTQYGTDSFSSLDEDWESKWDKQWDQWLNEK